MRISLFEDELWFSVCLINENFPTFVAMDVAAFAANVFLISKVEFDSPLLFPV
jgi:hypothetical protein